MYIGDCKLDALDMLLREHGSLDGLAAELGQCDPNAWHQSKGRDSIEGLNSG